MPTSGVDEAKAPSLLLEVHPNFELGCRVRGGATAVIWEGRRKRWRGDLRCPESSERSLAMRAMRVDGTGVSISPNARFFYDTNGVVRLPQRATAITPIRNP